MGQYHRVVNLDKKTYLDPHTMGLGAKLMEFGGSRLTEALTALLAVSNGRGGGDYMLENDSGLSDSIFGMWGGDKIAVVGDYWEEDEAKLTKIPTWDQMEETYINISMDVMEIMCQTGGWFRGELLHDVATYDFDRDWSSIFTKEEIAAEKQKIAKEREKQLQERLKEGMEF